MPLPRRNLMGDLLIQVFIEVPKSVSPKTEAELRKLAETEGETGFSLRKTYFDGLQKFMKDYFGKEYAPAPQKNAENAESKDRQNKKKKKAF